MNLYAPNTSDSIDNNILSKSSINLRLDISPSSATKEKPGTKYPAFLFSGVS